VLWGFWVVLRRFGVNYSDLGYIVDRKSVVAMKIHEGYDMELISLSPLDLKENLGFPIDKLSS
jgi:hypothetical protein